ncbi:MAG: twin-arginine translocation signal domain-containing protein [Ferruginibacter sp.]
MNRRNFLQKGTLATLAASVLPAAAKAFVPAHNWDGYNFGPGPVITDRLNQGPFPTNQPEEVLPEGEVIMATTPSKKVVPNYGMGLTTYLCDEAGPPRRENESLEKSLEKLISLPLGDKLYMRVDWRDIQNKPGKLDLCNHWKIAFDLAKQYNKRIGLRVQLMSPDIEAQSMPDFLTGKVPLYKFGTTNEIGLRGKVLYAPQYDHPVFMSALQDMDGLLSDMYNGHPEVEFIDTYMYGFWGEGHTWPFPDKNPFPDYITAEKTFIKIFDMQSRNWKTTPLLTNTQPDYSRVGNSEIVDRTVRSHNWLRTDTIFIENMQIESLSNRPAWTGGFIECGISDGTPGSLRISEGVTHSDSVISHAKDVGAHYFSLWNWHNIQAERLQHYYEQYPDAINDLSLRIGYRVRPSWIWSFEKDGYPGLVLGLANDGIAGVPGALRISILSSTGEKLSEGSLDAGYPLPGKIRQALFRFPKGTKLEGLKMYAELEVKGTRHKVNWACHQQTEADGALVLRKNI